MSRPRSKFCPKGHPMRGKNLGIQVKKDYSLARGGVTYESRFCRICKNAYKSRPDIIRKRKEYFARWKKVGKETLVNQCPRCRSVTKGGLCGDCLAPYFMETVPAELADAARIGVEA